MKKDLDICPGGDCPLRTTCERYFWWLQLDDEDGTYMEIEPAYVGNNCLLYKRREYYGG